MPTETAVCPVCAIGTIIDRDSIPAASTWRTCCREVHTHPRFIAVHAPRASVICHRSRLFILTFYCNLIRAARLNSDLIGMSMNFQLAKSLSELIGDAPDLDFNAFNVNGRALRPDPCQLHDFPHYRWQQ